ncbi:MAG: HAMP domain-containing sensor histidine kinase [Emcibacteraceae bacterium]|nr:HAMP domain-containing sensor histidine kinase [Emcibacteraceae bacterium]
MAKPTFNKSGNVLDIKGEHSNENNDEVLTENDPSDEVAAELLHNLSHEFRTPLNAIIGFSQMIDSEMWGLVSDQYKNNTKNIIYAANHLKDAVNNILDSAKVEAGLILPTPESFSLKSVIQDAMYAVAPILETKELNVSGIDDNIDVILYNDKHCIVLCLIKMITYATRKAELGDDLHISVLVSSKAEVRIEMPLINQNLNESDSYKLFEKVKNFGNLGNNTSDKSTEFETKISSGFGLSVAQDLAKLIGSDIKTLSKEGKITHIALTISIFPIEG